MAQVQHPTNSWETFWAVYAPRFSFLFLGLAAVRVWIQCCMYDRYTATDSGALTIVGTLVRVAVMLALIATCGRKGFSRQVERALDVAACCFMTASAAFYCIQYVFPHLPLSLIGSLCGSVGIAWGAVMWIRFYVCLEPGEALLYAFLGLALSALVGFVLGVCSPSLAYALCLVLPAASYLSWRSAWDALSKRPLDIQAPPCDCANDSLSKTSIVVMLLGLALINFALGVARGFPSGISIPLSLELQAFHQATVFVLCVATVWWVLVRGHRITLFSLWGVVCAFVVIGTALVTMGEESQMMWGAALITVGNSFSVAVLWYCAYDFSRHSSVKAYVVFGVIWIVHLLPRELGRLAIFKGGFAIGSTGAMVVAGMSIMVMMVLGMALVLNRRVGGENPFFRELAAAEAAVEIGEPEAPAAVPEAADAFAAVVIEPWVELGERYSLTDREVQMVHYLSMGRSRTYISEQLHLSENTVKSYIRNVYTKVGVHSKQELLDLMGQ